MARRQVTGGTHDLTVDDGALARPGWVLVLAGTRPAVQLRHHDDGSK